LMILMMLAKWLTKLNAAAKPAPYCPRCEFEYPIKYREIDEVEGDLKQLNAEDVIRENAAKRQEVGRARTLDDLRRIANERGYKSAWVRKMASVKGIRA